MSWSELPLRCKVYLICVCLSSIPISIASFSASPAKYELAWILLSLASFSVAAINLSLPQIPSIVISMGDVFTLVVLINFGPGPALITYWANVIATAVARNVRSHGFGSFGRLSFHRLLFNLSCCAASIFAMHYVWAKSLGLWSNNPSVNVLGYTAVAIAWFLVNTGTLSFAVSLASGKAFLSVWREGLSLYLLNFFCSAAAAGLLSILVKTFGYYTFFLCIPIVVGVYQLYSFYVQRFQDFTSRQ